MKSTMTTRSSLHASAVTAWPKCVCLLVALLSAVIGPLANSAQPAKVVSSYGPINQDVTFEQIKASRMAVKAERAREHVALLNARYDLSKKAAGEVRMSGGKPVPVGPTARLHGITWEQFDKLAPEQIRERGLFPYKPLPFADHAEGGMLFPAMITNVLPRLVRFDLDFDLPEHVLPDPAPAIYLTTRPDLGDVAKGRLVTLDNYYEIFNGLLNPKQLEGLRLLVTQFPQQQFNATEDRRTDRPSLGVACFDCHANGHANGTNHLVGDIRPQEFRHRIETPTLRGVNVQRLRGIKDSPPYLHDGRCLTLEDTVEYFNLIQQLRLKPEEKADLVAFMRCL